MRCVASRLAVQGQHSAPATQEGWISDGAGRTKRVCTPFLCTERKCLLHKTCKDMNVKILYRGCILPWRNLHEAHSFVLQLSWLASREVSFQMVKSSLTKLVGVQQRVTQWKQVTVPFVSLCRVGRIVTESFAELRIFSKQRPSHVSLAPVMDWFQLWPPSLCVKMAALKFRLCRRSAGCAKQSGTTYHMILFKLFPNI